MEIENFYSIEDLHGSVCDIYYQLDEGEISPDEATEILKACCVQFLNSTERVSHD